MIPYYKILAGLLIGLAVGALNFYLMRTFVRLSLKNKGRALGAFIIMLSYGLRYLLIGLVAFWLVKMNEQVIALIMLAVLAAMTLLLAALQQKRKSGTGG